MTLEEIINTWYTLATGGVADQDNLFFRFIAVWVAFNALYASKYSNESGDREQVMRFVGQPEVIDHHRCLIESDVNYLNYINVLRERGVGNLRGGGRRQISEPRNLNEVASCFYQVRCNLFHGGKAPGNPRDENLINASYYILLKLISPWIPNI